MNSDEIEAPELRNGRDTGMPANRARQAVIGHNVRYVLIFGLIGSVFALTLIYVFFFVGRVA